jgi:hypothetical protein
MADPQQKGKYTDADLAPAADVATSNTGASDDRNQFQKNFDAASADVSPEEMRAHPILGPLKQFVHTVGGYIGAPIAHPAQSLKNLGSTARDVFDYATTPFGQDHSAITGDDLNAGPMAKQVDSIRNDFHTMPMSQSIAKTAGAVTGMYLGGKAMGAAGTAAVDALPSASRAASAFESLNTDLANHPVPLKATLKPLQRITEIGERGSQLPTAVSKLLQRSQSPIDMTFPEARDYQASLSDLSGSDKLAMNGRVRGGVAQLNKALFSDIQDAAEGAGRGEDYAKAMKEYRQASQLKDMARKAVPLATKAAVGYGGYRAIKDISDTLGGR